MIGSGTYQGQLRCLVVMDHAPARAPRLEDKTRLRLGRSCNSLRLCQRKEPAPTAAYPAFLEPFRRTTITGGRGSSAVQRSVRDGSNLPGKLRNGHTQGVSTMTAITPDLLVDDVMRRWPATIRVFLD